MQLHSISDLIGVFFCGTVTLLLFLVFVIYLKTLESIYLYYALFLFFILLYAITYLKEVNGFENAILHYLKENRRYGEPATILSFSFYIFFAIELITLKQRPKLERFLFFFGIGGIVYSVLYFLLFDYIAVHHLLIFIISRIIIFSLSFYFLLQIWLKVQSPLKPLLLIGSIFYFIGSITASLRHSGAAVPFEGFYIITSTSYFQIGIMFQTLFFALALVERLVFRYQEQASAQKTLFEELSFKERVAKEVNKGLEEEIEARIKEVIVIKEDLQDQERRRLTAEYERNLIQSEILAKQAQINPHFIFNSLNAIKFLILQNENKKAIKYLVTFSRFVRTTLDRMDEHIIPLEAELEIINDYMELEKKRFNDDFSFRIDRKENNQLTDFYIPPLLLQPFVENAIWHGLLTSEKEEKNLTIAVQKTKSGLKISIEDNGVGRGERLPKLSGNKHESMGISLTKERIKLFNHNNTDLKIRFEIMDIKDEKCNPLGTTVEVFLDVIPKLDLLGINKQINKSSERIEPPITGVDIYSKKGLR